MYNCRLENCLVMGAGSMSLPRQFRGWMTLSYLDSCTWYFLRSSQALLVWLSRVCLQTNPRQLTWRYFLTWDRDHHDRVTLVAMHFQSQTVIRRHILTPHNLYLFWTLDIIFLIGVCEFSMLPKHIAASNCILSKYCSYFMKAVVRTSYFCAKPMKTVQRGRKQT